MPGSVRFQIARMYSRYVLSFTLRRTTPFARLKDKPVRSIESLGVFWPCWPLVLFAAGMNPASMPLHAQTAQRMPLVL